MRAVRRTSRSASWTSITCCPSPRAGQIMPTICNCSAQAVIAARADARWPNGGPHNDQKTPRGGRAAARGMEPFSRPHGSNAQKFDTKSANILSGCFRRL